ncbi:MAG: OsmC family protein [Bacteroidales bacterium]|nr:OsmC family protein [Bacteroidales bacterium]
MTKMTSKYVGGLRTENTHLQSGSKLITDAPLDNHGKGEAFSPTDLLATALCDCIFTITGITAETYGFSIDGATAEIEKIMNDSPRRVAEVIINFDYSMCSLNEKQRTIIQRIPDTCPVSRSLSSDVKQTINFKF